MDKAKGKMKEAAGALTNDEDKRTEGQAQQRKGAAEEEMTKKEKAPSKQRRKPDKQNRIWTGRGERTRGCWVTSRIPCRASKTKRYQSPPGTGGRRKRGARTRSQEQRSRGQKRSNNPSNPSRPTGKLAHPCRNGGWLPTKTECSSPAIL
jgi:uncharacterized protein YjbJ (UPF0337 family)